MGPCDDKECLAEFDGSCTAKCVKSKGEAIMSKGPCLCGDSYCMYCGNPGAAALEDAEQGVIDAFDKMKFSVEEYRITMTVGIAAVEAHRKAMEVELNEQLSGYAQYCDQLKGELEILKAGRS